MAEVIHVCNGGEQAVKDIQTVASIAALDSWKGKEVSAWLVFAHLTWDGQKLSQNCGFDVAQRIRMEFGSMAPIVFYSPITEAYFAQLNDVKYKLLNGCGTAFLETPSSTKAYQQLLERTEPLTKSSLLDVVTMLCNVRGWVVDRLNHDLKPDRASAPVFSAVEPLLSRTQRQEVQFEHYRAQFATLDVGRNNKAFMDLRAKFIQSCDVLLPTEARSRRYFSKDKKLCHVLLLEDDPQYRTIVEGALKKRFTVDAVSTSTKAKELLDKDKECGDIHAVICDWRLYEYSGGHKTDRWQRPQGYGVLEYAAKEGVRALYALTSQDDRLVHAIRNQANRRYMLFKKEHLNGEAQWDAVLDVIQEGCQQALLDRADRVIQGAKGWVAPDTHDRSKREAYLDIWNSVDWDVFLEEVTARADSAWGTYLGNSRAHLVGKHPELESSVKVNDRDAMVNFFALRRLYFAIWSKQPIHYTRTQCDIAVQTRIWGSDRSAGQRRNQLCIDFKHISAERMFPEELAWVREREKGTG